MELLTENLSHMCEHNGCTGTVTVTIAKQPIRLLEGQDVGTCNQCGTKFKFIRTQRSEGTQTLELQKVRL